MTHQLESALLDLHQRLSGSGINLIVGGGFGLYLKVRNFLEMPVRTLLQILPDARATADIDLFLRPELLIDSHRLRPLVEALTDLGYRPVPGREHYQFERLGPGGSPALGTKIDVLTGPRSRFDGTPVRTDERRVRPSPSIGLHAHHVNAAPTLEEQLITIKVAGLDSKGHAYQAEIGIPHPFTYLTMKLGAFSDQLDSEDESIARSHATDLYTIIAYMTEPEWNSAEALRDQFATDPFVQAAGLQVSNYFGSPNAIGVLRLRESPSYRRNWQLDEFLAAMRDLFPEGAPK